MTNSKSKHSPQRMFRNECFAECFAMFCDEPLAEQKCSGAVKKQITGSFVLEYDVGVQVYLLWKGKRRLLKPKYTYKIKTLFWNNKINFQNNAIDRIYCSFRKKTNFS